METEPRTAVHAEFRDAKRLTDLRSLMQRGRLRLDTDLKKERVAAILFPLPPPWEWQVRREIAGYTATDMSNLVGYHEGRIRFWEKGGGTNHPEWWISYAYTMSSIIPASVNGAISVSELNRSQHAQDSRVASLIEMMRSLEMNFDFVLREQALSYSAADAELLAKAAFQACRTLRAAETRLRRYISAQLQENNQRKGNQ